MDTNYPDFESGDEFCIWVRVSGFCYKSLGQRCAVRLWTQIHRIFLRTWSDSGSKVDKICGHALMQTLFHDKCFSNNY